ncbi:MAG: succinate dehydrogenase/fumarate reductase iron-sulfur subunit [Deltaproteobacteria bacterium]|nr:succinate dehydrogenase/fumarate reductase iron-sulfur subunit [Deltaproteobacteria bacterium]
MSTLSLTLKVWRQKDSDTEGHFAVYELKGISTHMSFLEMMDVLNEKLIQENQDPVAFDHDCREGICGMCSMVINGQAHGPEKETTTCQLHMRHFRDGDTIVIEPWRAKAFPVIKDLSVDRSAFDRIILAGGYNSVNVGNAPDGNAILVPKTKADLAMEAAACIGCGACVAACKNASASLFVGAKISHLAHLPQGEPERKERAQSMVAQMDAEGFGACTNTYECQAACPAGIKIEVIAKMNREYIKSSF